MAGGAAFGAAALGASVGALAPCIKHHVLSTLLKPHSCFGILQIHDHGTALERSYTAALASFLFQCVQQIKTLQRRALDEAYPAPHMLWRPRCSAESGEAQGKGPSAGGEGGAYRAEALLTAGQLALARRLVLGAAGLELVCNGLLADLLGLLLVDGLHEHTLVLVHVTLHLHTAADRSGCREAARCLCYAASA